MATLVDLTDQEIAELKEFTKQEDVAAAIRIACGRLKYAIHLQD
jgi:hypothetical protein